MTKCLFLIYRNLNVQQIIADGPAFGMFTGYEVYPVTDIPTDSILYYDSFTLLETDSGTDSDSDSYRTQK